MDRSLLSRQTIPLFLQFLLISGGIAFSALIPPAHGAMVAIPLVPQMRSEGMSRLIASGARIERAGPTSGSLVLVADRNAIAADAIRHGILLLPTAIAGCRSGSAAT
ncbi:hypothetical protein KFK14_01530 [Sphingobium phenoxybenzoativorans]|uniref:Uncharacterized protein n=1 Tax=Sphingobium phenoxybenzoativorans TaxID=1592790 RepID=A0A975K828_9SPHN|nr:hypothetical protein [Sphingobium phenoxybenzoativorans]QUT06197.1 hypothetical protein KFK14_01530 [Sphingobium phenoxybenzoativorans]